MAQPKGMIFLEPGNKIIEEFMRDRLFGDRVGPAEFSFNDFNQVSFKLFVPQTESGEDIIYLDMYLPSYQQLVDYGAIDGVKEIVGPLYNEEGPNTKEFSIGLVCELNNLPFPKERVLEIFRDFRNIVVSIPFRKCFTELLSLKNSAPQNKIFTYDWRKNEAIYIVPAKDRVHVIFAIDFGEETDQAIARIFLQEFEDTQRTINNAPVCSFRRTAPPELASLNLPPKKPILIEGSSSDYEEGIAGYITFALFDRHISTPKRLENSINMLLGFRDYMLFHIKASKTYLHMRMRERVDNLLKVLKRAMPVVETEKKTASGKSFKRSFP